VVGGVARFSNYHRSAILILLRERDSHGYELVQRMVELGLGPLVAASIYGVLRSMEAEGLVTSSWDTSRRGGPPRRVYAKTPEGEAYLSDMAPVLSQQREALGAMLDRYRATSSDD
jgi:PadR family transcriptional regulator PadR